MRTIPFILLAIGFIYIVTMEFFITSDNKSKKEKDQELIDSLQTEIRILKNDTFSIYRKDALFRTRFNIYYKNVYGN